MTRKNLFYLVLLTLILFACSRPEAISETPQIKPPRVVFKPSETPPANPLLTQEAAPPLPPLLPETLITLPSVRSTKYVLVADFDYRARTLDVVETVHYVNTTDSQVIVLPLIVDPQRRKDVFILEEITWGDGNPVSDYSLRSGTLLVELARPIQPDEMMEIRLKYHLDIPHTAAPFGATGRQVNLANWYAFVPAYRPGLGWLMHEPGRVGEYFAYDVADYDVTIRLVGRETAVTIAAGVPADVLGNEYQYHHSAARNFSWSASTDYVIVWSRADNIVVSGYVFPEHKETGLIAAGFVSQAISLFNNLYGSVPQASLSFVEADFPDGMEYEGIYFLDQVYFSPHLRSAQSGLAALSVHETAHQWWGGLVANDQAMEPWLDESLCVFSELLFYEQLYPSLVGWWWEYRIDSFRPGGYINTSIYQYKEFRPYVNAVYLRGALFIDEVRNRIGNDNFLAFLREYAHTYAYRLAVGDDFFSTLKRFTTMDLSDLREGYFQP